MSEVDYGDWHAVVVTIDGDPTRTTLEELDRDDLECEANIILGGVMDGEECDGYYAGAESTVACHILPAQEMFDDEEMAELLEQRDFERDAEVDVRVHADVTGFMERARCWEVGCWVEAHWEQDQVAREVKW